MIVEVPVFFSNEKRPMRVEIQIRTVAMDFWASLEHKMKYKQDIDNAEEIMAELKECADTISQTDIKMMRIREKVRLTARINSGAERITGRRKYRDRNRYRHRRNLYGCSNH